MMTVGAAEEEEEEEEGVRVGEDLPEDDDDEDDDAAGEVAAAMAGVELELDEGESLDVLLKATVKVVSEAGLIVTLSKGHQTTGSYFDLPLPIQLVFSSPTRR